MIRLSLIYIFIFSSLFSQIDESKRIIERVKTNIDLIQDYSADVKIKVDFPDAIIPDIAARIYYKKPDKIKVDSDNFLIIPKQSIKFGPDVIFQENYTSVLTGETNIDGIKHFIIRIIPEDQNVGEFITIFVNSKNYTIKRISVLSARAGKVDIEFDYILIDNKFWLPRKIEALLETKGIKFPRLRQMEKERQQQKENKQNNNLGRLTIEYSNFSVNKGIDDLIFNEDNKIKIK